MPKIHAIQIVRSGAEKWEQAREVNVMKKENNSLLFKGVKQEENRYHALTATTLPPEAPYHVPPHSQANASPSKQLNPPLLL